MFAYSARDQRHTGSHRLLWKERGEWDLTYLDFRSKCGWTDGHIIQGCLIFNRKKILINIENKQSPEKEELLDLMFLEDSWFNSVNDCLQSANYTHPPKISLPSVDAASENTQNLLSSGLQKHNSTHTHTQAGWNYSSDNVTELQINSTVCHTTPKISMKTCLTS